VRLAVAIACAVIPAVPLVTGCGAGATSTSPRTYYVSPSGDDSRDGKSPASAWRSLDRANRAVLAPGDKLLLRGGSEFPGALVLGTGDAGRADAPVVVGSYGAGRAVIRAGGAAAVSIVNTAGVEIHDLVLAGDPTAARTSGIVIFADLPGRPRYPHITVTDVDVSGFRNGIEVGGAHGAGFRDVRISRSVVHDNVESGLLIYGPPFDEKNPAYAHEHVVISEVTAHHNLGDRANVTRNTGSGIVLGSVDGGTGERSSAHDNGAFCFAPEGPGGIWSYDSKNVLIQRNLSYRNHSGTSADGDGFDFDQNVTGSILQYNLSYNNDGAGFLLYNRSGLAHANNVVRFNISAEDGQRTSRYGGITLSGRIRDAAVYNNTVVISGVPGRQPAGLKLELGLRAVTVRNNIFRVTGPSPVVVAAQAFGTDQVLLQGNVYVGIPGRLVAWWAGRVYSRLSSWRANTGQERLGDQNVGMTADPWTAPPNLPDLTDPAHITDATAFMVPPASPAAGAGLDLRRLFGLDPGPADFWSGRLAGTRPSIGAHQPAIPPA
jgi:Right handed beta helix region